MVRRALAALCGAIVALSCAGTAAMARAPCGKSDYGTSCDGAMDARWQVSGDGWLAADGTYSVTLPDGRELWLFGDSFIGTAGGRQLVNNSAVVTGGPALDTRLGAGGGSYFPAPAAGALYWPSDATVEGSAVRMFAARIDRTGSGAWDFARTDCAIFSADATTLQPAGSTAVPDCARVNWGAAILEAPDGYTYVYGIQDNPPWSTWVHVARVHAGHLTDEPWEYRTSTGWSPQPTASTPIHSGASQQFSVVTTPDGYALVTQSLLFGREITASVSSSPAGPFTRSRVLYTTPDDESGTITYNAVAHADHPGGRGLLISYNRNGPWDDVVKDLDRYRPRFIRVPFSALAAVPERLAQPESPAPASAPPLTPDPPPPVEAPAPPEPAAVAPAQLPAAPRAGGAPRAVLARTIRVARITTRATRGRLRVCAVVTGVPAGTRTHVRSGSATVKARTRADGRVCAVLRTGAARARTVRVTVQYAGVGRSASVRVRAPRR
jgi:hypothetical protein